MHTKDIARLSALWDELTHIDPADRAAWLSQRPPEDQPLLADLMRMLSDDTTASDIAGGTLSMTSCGDFPGQAVAAAGQQVGNYSLQTLLGRGGMGEVWLARTTQGPASRQVAIKLPFINTATAAARLRFQRECSILAALNHPAIATLYEAGVTAAGQAYLAMEYVAGETLLAYADAQRLALRRRVELVASLAEATAHAHQRLIIHRDIKPSNVLVTADGQLKLLDFGVAKALDDQPGDAAGLTQLAGHMVTLAYAAPEQIEHLPLTTAVDVHALGVVCYELLCGTRPSAARRKRHELQAFILAEHRPLASQLGTDDGARRCGLQTRHDLSKQLRGDLNTILQRAVAREPSDRYAGAQALAEDLRRWLDHRPILARPPSARYLARKFVQRHRRGVALSACAAAALAGLTLISLHNARQSQQHERLASAQGQRAEALSRFLSDTIGGTASLWGEGG